MIAMRSRNVPALRLEGFDGEWELKAIGDLSGRTYGGGTPSSDEPGYWSGDIPWIQSSDVAEQGVAPVAPRKHITREAISRSAAMQIPADSVAVVTRVGVGKVSFMPFPYATSQDFVSLSDLSGDPEYIALTVKRRMEGLADQLQGSTIKGITKTELFISPPLSKNSRPSALSSPTSTLPSTSTPRSTRLCSRPRLRSCSGCSRRRRARRCRSCGWMASTVSGRALR